MAAKFPARTALRDATADLHEAVDRAFSPTDLSDRAGYGRFLVAQAAAHIAVEEAVERGGAADILGDWSGRQRAHLLKADLAALGLTVPAAIGTPEFAHPAAVLGAVYVLEGSRLGGALLKRSVPAEFPCSFLGASDPAGWRRLLGQLDQHIRNADELQIAINAARQAFMLFERSGIHLLRAVHVEP